MKKKEAHKIRFDILTIFPRILDSYIQESLLKRAIEGGLAEFNFHDIRKFSKDRHRKVDDTPFGGGPGMVLKIEPIYEAVKHILGKMSSKRTRRRIVLFSTRGRKLDSRTAKRLSRYDQLIFICGRYEGVDERIAMKLADEEISIGDYVLSGGELPAMVTAEAVLRYVPGFLGKYESLEDLKGSYPVYTKPANFEHHRGEKWSVPRLLLSGDHKKIAEWRKRHTSSS